MSGNQNSGRKAKEGGVRTSIIVDAEVYNYLSRHGNVSAEVERITREDMGTHADTRTIEIGRRSKVGWGYTCWTPEHPEPPSKPDHVGTWRTVSEAIDTDRGYRSLKSGGTYLSTTWFARVNGAWRRIAEGNLSELDYDETIKVTVE